MSDLSMRAELEELLKDVKKRGNGGHNDRDIVRLIEILQRYVV